MFAELIERTHISVIDRGDDSELQRIAETIASPVIIEGRADLEAALCAMLAHGRAGVAKTLDLIGHSTVRTSLLSIGDWVIDASSPTVTAFFRELADQAVLSRLGIESVRLLGCETAVTSHGKWTVCALAEILGVEVYGTTGPVLASHYDADGFAHERRYLLVSSTEMRAHGGITRPLPEPRSSEHVLDIDALSPVPLDQGRVWPVHVVSPEQARELLCLVRRMEGAILPSLDVRPSCEIALPSAITGRYHRLEVLLGGELVRVHPPGAPTGIVYPVSDVATFRELIAYAAGR